jgi:hypothetical protein
MNTALAQIQEEIVKLEARLKLLHAAETALLELDMVPGPVEKGKPVFMTYKESDKLSIPETVPPKGLAPAIRDLLGKEGPMTKAGIDKALSKEEWSLAKGAVSGSLQSMKVRGAVARTKAGKWTVK